MILIQYSLKDNDGYTRLFERNKIYRKVLPQRHFTNSHESYAEWRRSMRSPRANILSSAQIHSFYSISNPFFWLSLGVLMKTPNLSLKRA